MAFLGQSGSTAEVDPEEVNQKRGGRILDAGWYRAALIEDEAGPYDWGVGLNMQFQILTGDFAPQRIFEFLCIEHTKEKVQHIARIRLRELAIAAGHKSPEDVQDTGSIYNVPVMVEIYRAKDDSKYAEPDGKRPRVGQFMSVAEWKANHSDEPMPGVGRAPAPNNSPPPVAAAPPPAAPPDDDDLPF